MLQTPGIVEIRDKELLLIPAFGNALRVPLSAIRGVRETEVFNGSCLPAGACGFWLDGISTKRLGLALAEGRAVSVRSQNLQT